MKELKFGDKERAALDAALSRLGLELEDEKKEILLLHLQFLFEENETTNLTRITGYEKAISLHVEDSLSVLPYIYGVDASLLDIGTGGGFPGLPLTVVSGKEFTLLDSVKKKAAATKRIVERLGLDGQVSVSDVRSEELARKKRESFDGVVMRAVSSLPVCEELATPLLKKDGKLFLLKSDISEEETKDGMEAAEILGLSLVDKKTCLVGEEKAKRLIFIFEKTGEAGITLPRRPGMAVKRPLPKK